jgi:biopolymer transport protein ExbD
MDDFSGAEGWGRSSAISGLIPLIDVLLVVLTFLVWVALAPAGPGTPPQASKQSLAPDPSRPLQVVALSIAGEWYLNGQAITKNELLSLLQSESRNPQAARVLFLPSNKLSIETVGDSFQQLKARAGERLRLRLPAAGAGR